MRILFLLRSPCPMRAPEHRRCPGGGPAGWAVRPTAEERPGFRRARRHRGRDRAGGRARPAVGVSSAVRRHTRAQLDANLAALTVGQLPALDLAASPRAYWAAR